MLRRRRVGWAVAKIAYTAVYCRLFAFLAIDLNGASPRVRRWISRMGARGRCARRRRHHLLRRASPTACRCRDRGNRLGRYASWWFFRGASPRLWVRSGPRGFEGRWVLRTQSFCLCGRGGGVGGHPGAASTCERCGEGAPRRRTFLPGVRRATQPSPRLRLFLRFRGGVYRLMELTYVRRHEGWAVE